MYTAFEPKVLELEVGTFSYNQLTRFDLGVLMCGETPLANTKVKLWDDDSGPDLDDLLAEGHTDSRGYFEISGHTSEITTIDPVS